MNHFKKSLIAWIAALAVSGLATSAEASMVAGWDFSQWAGAGFLTTNGSTFQASLAANYSALDPGSPGIESNPYGTLYFDGTNGSSPTTGLGMGTEQFVPTGGSLGANINAPVTGGSLNPFDSFGALTPADQMFTQLLSMTANTSFSVVFEANLTSLGSLGTDWELSFGGKTFGNSSSLGIDFSVDGMNYAALAPVALDGNELQVILNLGTVASDTAFVRFNFDNNDAIIDNVAINATVSAAPEPATMVLLGLGLAGLGFARRRS